MAKVFLLLLMLFLLGPLALAVEKMPCPMPEGKRLREIVEEKFL